MMARYHFQKIPNTTEGKELVRFKMSTEICNKTKSRLTDAMKREKKRIYDAEWWQNNKEKKRIYDAKYQQNNKEKRRIDQAEYRQNNKEKIRIGQAKYRQNNKEKIRIYDAKYKQNNKEIICYHNSTRRAKLLNAIPSWLLNCKVEKKRISSYFALSEWYQKIDGIKRHVDHMWPLSDGGPHWSGNLQILTALENNKKWAKVCPIIKKQIQLNLEETRNIMSNSLNLTKRIN
tara:strand:- start:274 stop:969 length:696 start_codon:yes stop_codon:yes gene_type:complete